MKNVITYLLLGLILTPYAVQSAAPLEDLQELEDDVAWYVNTLTPQQRANFNQEIEKHASALESMSEEQLLETINAIAPGIVSADVLERTRRRARENERLKTLLLSYPYS